MSTAAMVVLVVLTLLMHAATAYGVLYLYQENQKLQGQSCRCDKCQCDDKCQCEERSESDEADDAADDEADDAADAKKVNNNE